MSSQTKHLIELSDIVGVCFECKHCGTSISAKASQPIAVSKLRKCPNCNADWLHLESGSTIESDVEEFFKAVDGLKSKLKNRIEVMKQDGVIMTLEIADCGPEKQVRK